MMRLKTFIATSVFAMFIVGVTVSGYTAGYIKQGNVISPKPFHKIINECLSVEEAKASDHGAILSIRGAVACSDSKDSYLVDKDSGIGMKISGLPSLKLKDEVEIKGQINVDDITGIKTVINAEFIKQIAANVPLKEMLIEDLNTINNPMMAGNLVKFNNLIYKSNNKNVFTFALENNNLNIIDNGDTALEFEKNYLRMFSNGFSKIKVDFITSIVGYADGYKAMLQTGNKIQIDYLDALMQALILDKHENGQCKSQFYVAKKYCLAMPLKDIETFKNSSLPDIKAARNRYLAWAAYLNEDPYMEDGNSNDVILLNQTPGYIIITLSMVTISTFLLIAYQYKRKKVRK